MTNERNFSPAEPEQTPPSAPDAPTPAQPAKAVKPVMGYSVGTWAGLPNYVCDYCPDFGKTASLNEDDLRAHVESVHPLEHLRATGAASKGD